MGLIDLAVPQGVPGAVPVLHRHGSQQADYDVVEKLDPYTVKFTLKEINAPFIQNLAMEYASISLRIRG